MRRWFNLNEVDSNLTPSVVAIGVFDGVIQQIERDLRESDGIDRAHDARGDVPFQHDVFLLKPVAEGVGVRHPDNVQRGDVAGPGAPVGDIGTGLPDHLVRVLQGLKGGPGRLGVPPLQRRECARLHLVKLFHVEHSEHPGEEVA